MFFKKDNLKTSILKIMLASVLSIVAICILVFITINNSTITQNMTDAERFYMEFKSVPIDNVFKYTSLNEAYNLMQAKSAVIFFGFSDCLWCKNYAKILDEVAKTKGIDTVYYVDIYKARKEKSREYQKLTELLQEYLDTDEKGEKRLYVPDVYFIKDKVIVGHNNDTSRNKENDVEEYYLINGKDLKNKLSSLFDLIIDSHDSCDDKERAC